MASSNRLFEIKVLHGWLILDKPVGIGSTDAVTTVKRAVRAGGYARVKVGHGGTLDPLASGVLPIALGEATKLAGRMLDADKVYEFTIGFGVETDTLDAEGVAVTTSAERPTSGAIDAVLPRFTGVIEQAPPAYSALKIGGKPAYARARAGEIVEMKTREVTVHGLIVRHPGPDPGSRADERDACSPTTWMPDQDWHDDGERVNEVTISAHVSKGTYIRSLARDIARVLGTVGHVTMLRRTHAGPFGLASAISLDKLAELARERRLEQVLLPLTAGLDDIPALFVTTDQARLLRQGRKLIGISAQPGLHLATEAEAPVALVEVSGSETRVVRGFNL